MVLKSWEAWKETALSAINHLLEPSQTQQQSHTFRAHLGPDAQDPTAPSRHLSNEEISQRFESRRQILQWACRRELDAIHYGRSVNLKSMSIPAQGSMLYNVNYCPIPKTGSTTWRGIFGSIKSARRKLKGVEMSMEERGNISFAFVREPYSRLLSAYVDKLFTPNFLFSRMLGRYIVENFRFNASALSRRCGFDVTFPEFIRYFIHMQTTGIKRDLHFVPTHEQCLMCDQNYTFLGHLETIKEDIPYILEAMNSPVTYNQNFDNVTIVKNTLLVLQRSRARFEPCMDLEEASRRLWKKWQIRGVLSKTQAFPLSGKKAWGISVSSLTEAGLAALGRSGTRGSRVGQKREALREAFASISLEDKLKVRHFLQLDFQMFGFDPEPKEVFPSSLPPQEKGPYFSYFDLYP
ncbi:hypothetical protein ACOMHN_051854 [Nucella lapillus]